MKIKRISKIKEENEIRIEEIMSDRPRKPINEDPNLYISTYQSLINYPKEFFKQFHTVACDEAHGSKSTTVTSILKRTFTHAYNRFGVSGTFPPDDSLEILTIQSVLGPKVTQIEASTLVQSGTITPMQIKAVILNHSSGEVNEKKMVEKCESNTLLLFHTIEYGTKIFEKLKNEIKDKEFYYIDGEVSGKNRDLIKKEMEKTDGKVRVLIASFGTVGTGYSINNLHYLLMVDSFKSEQIVIQAIGRVLRLFDGKKKAVIFDLVDVFDTKDQSNILYKHYLERQKFYNQRKYPFNEIKINL
ncbi:hypothetical protein EBU71_15725 [bacterium]|nr:hypothetical protein [Candidatus Elulimicrobium humile]